MGQGLSVARADTVFFHRFDEEARMELDIAGGQEPPQPAPHRAGVPHQDFRVRGHQRAPCRIGIARAHRECKLHAAGAPAHQYEAHRPALQLLADRVPPGQKLADRLDGCDPGSFRVPSARYAAGVEGQDVVTQWRAVFHDHPVAVEVQSRDFRGDQAGVGEAGEPRHVDVHLVAVVAAGDMSRQHPRVRRVDFAGDHREADARLWPHAEVPQHLHMAVPRADEHDVADGGCGRLHRLLATNGAANGAGGGATLLRRTRPRGHAPCAAPWPSPA